MLVLVVGRHGLRDDDAVGGLDGPAVAADVGEELPRVPRRVRERLVARDLEVGELGDEDREEHEHRDADATNPLVHRAPGAGVGDGSERTASSDMRSRIASNAKFATSDDPPYETNGNEMPV